MLVVVIILMVAYYSCQILLLACYDLSLFRLWLSVWIWYRAIKVSRVLTNSRWFRLDNGIFWEPSWTGLIAFSIHLVAELFPIFDFGSCGKLGWWYQHNLHFLSSAILMQWDWLECGTSMMDLQCHIQTQITPTSWHMNKKVVFSSFIDNIFLF